MQDQSRRTPPIAVVCPVCERPFTTWPYKLRTGVPACSLACRARRLRSGEARTCEVCSRGFYVTASRIRSGDAGRFCSHACNGQWSTTQRDSTGRDSARNREWGRAVRERDGFTCRHCGRTGTGHAMHAHHVKGWHDFPDLRFDVDNGITLCRRCHGRVHGGPNVARTVAAERRAR